MLTEDARAREVWARLISGRPLTDLGLSTIDGRIDLRGLMAPEPAAVRELVVANANVKQLGNLISVRGVHWKSLDVSESALSSLRFFDARIEDCRFDWAQCGDWRMWGTTIERTSFVGADLRQTALGGLDQGKRNAFRQVDFSNADLRQSAHMSADMIDCTFADTNLSKLDFQGTVFKNCSFSGDLEEVQFYDHAFHGEALPENRMEGCDFRKARLYHVEFRRLDMSDVQWPEDPDHVLIRSYPTTLDRMLALLEGRNDLPARQMKAVLGMKRKWSGPHQEIGVINKRELLEYASEELVNDVLAVATRAN
jgi:uncharacterized protein YjbI with pentapeptide repeats